MGRSVRLSGWIKTVGRGRTGDMWVSHDPSQVVGVVFLFCCSSGIGGSRPGVYSGHTLGPAVTCRALGFVSPIRKALCSGGVSVTAASGQPGSDCLLTALPLFLV